MNAFVLYDDGIPASTGMYYAFDTFSVENIGTKPSFGRKGYAQIIIKHLLQEAKKLEYAKAYLVDSKGSQAYINLGFKTLQETMTFVSPH